MAVAQQCPGHVYEARAAVSRTRSSAAGQRLLLSVISLSATAVAVANSEGIVKLLISRQFSEDWSLWRWILRSAGASVPFSGEPLFRSGLAHRDAVG